MDYETGEDHLGHITVGLDLETGELPAAPEINSETGESELNRTQPEAIVKKPFKIPIGYINNNEDEKKGEESIEADQQSQDPESQANKSTKRKCFFSTKMERKTSPCILFLLPTVFFFFPAISIPLGILEIILHIWAHKKNKRLRRKDIYFQSPLHIFVSEFCATCRFEASKNKITELQDKRNRRKMLVDDDIEYVKRIV